jgi:hypothetical protein
MPCTNVRFIKEPKWRHGNLLIIIYSSTTKACDGPCSGKTCCTSKCSGGSPVCGANGKDYDSQCLAICE